MNEVFTHADAVGSGHVIRAAMNKALQSATGMELVISIDLLSGSMGVEDLRTALASAPEPHGSASQALHALAKTLAEPDASTDEISKALQHIPDVRPQSTSDATVTPLGLCILLMALQRLEGEPSLVEKVRRALEAGLQRLGGYDAGTLALYVILGRDRTLPADLRSTARATIAQTIGEDLRCIGDVVSSGSGVDHATRRQSIDKVNTVLPTLELEHTPLPSLAVAMRASIEVVRALHVLPGLERRDLLLDALRRFRAATRRLTSPSNEADFQSQLWVIVKALFPDASDERHTDEFAGVENKPDFKIPSARLLVDAKFIRKDERAELRRFRQELSDKVVSYLQKSPEWDELLIVFYDNVSLLGKHPGFLEDFNNLDRVTVVVVQ